MAWQTASYKLTSQAPLLMHNGQTADPRNKFAKLLKQISSKRKKTDADLDEMARIEFMAGLYMGEEGPILPSFVLDSLIINAAKKFREGTLAKSACFSSGHAQLVYDGPKTPDELWADETFQFSALVRIGQSRVPRMRPIFNKWSAIVTVQFEDSLVNKARVDEWMETAGIQVGLGDWRPQYGRFDVERV